MTLQEFFNDESYGGSWADDDIDMASISVPIERVTHYNSSYSHDGFSSHHSGGAGGGGGGSMAGDNGPPYIVKLLNLPVTANDAFVTDLFQSRFTTFKKSKIVVDPSSNILETHVIKRVAFVELNSFQDLGKVVKWHDLFYKGTRRVIVEMADFNDFQYCIQFNKEHDQEIQQIQDDFIASKQQQHQPRHMALLDNIQIDTPSSRYHPPTRNNFQRGPGGFGTGQGPRGISPQQHHFDQPPLHHENSQHHEEHKHKSNPFGDAKPVDTLTRQQEIEKKLINLNKTTVQTLGPEGELPPDVEQTIKEFHEKASPTLRRSSINSGSRRSSTDNGRKSSVSILKRPTISDHNTSSGAIAHPTPSTITPAHAATTIPLPTNSPYSINGSGKSMAEMLSEQSHDNSGSGGRNTPTKGHTPKPIVSKPVILKKKINTTSSPQPKKLDLTIKESEVIKLEDEKKEQKHNEEVEVSKKTPVEVDQKKKDIEKATESISKVEITQSKPITTKPSTDFDDEERPDFRKHLSELVQKATPVPPKEKRFNNQYSSYKGNHNNSFNTSYNKRPYHTSNNINNNNNGNNNNISNNNHSNNQQVNVTESENTVSSNGDTPTPATDNQPPTTDENRRYRSQRQPYYPGDRYRNHSPTKNKSKVFNKPAVEKVSNENTEPSKSDIPVSVSETKPKPQKVEKVVESKPREESKPPTLEVISSKSAAEDEKSKDKADEIDSSASQDTSSSNTRGRGRGRGGFRGRGRGSSRGTFEGRGNSRGGRGRGNAAANFNLRYVRAKPGEEAKTE
ncbi:hypothetical protein DFJ63DRAFT_151499 [Scheffersomyces coipomensis]|uniref:uncharacterized protein n=1 Tax=Scheffersomyces coipomensis TaxID=1788519 RepID=UPI00315D7BB7